MDELATDDVQGVSRKYRYAGPVEIDRLKAAVVSDPRGRVRANAVTALISCFVLSPRKDTLLPLLVRALDDRDPDVETRAGEGLAAWFLTAPGVRLALSGHLDSLRAAVASKDQIVQAHAIRALQQMGERPPTAGMLAATNGEYRREGIEQAKVTGDASVVPLLIQISKIDPELVIRMEAVPVAAHLASPATRDTFLAALIDRGEPSHVAEAAIQAAVETGAVAVVPQLRHIVADQKHDDLASAAIAALQALQGRH
jgi:HEAT repeat protein